MECALPSSQQHAVAYLRPQSNPSSTQSCDGWLSRQDTAGGVGRGQTGGEETARSTSSRRLKASPLALSGLCSEGRAPQLGLWRQIDEGVSERAFLASPRYQGWLGGSAVVQGEGREGIVGPAFGPARQSAEKLHRPDYHRSCRMAVSRGFPFPSDWSCEQILRTSHTKLRCNGRMGNTDP